MALSPDSVFRGVAAAIAQPASEDDVLDQLSPIITGLTLYNREGPSILYRNSDNDQDIIEAVYRWDTRPPSEIFQTGFRPWPQSSTQSEANYYNLEQFVNGGGMPGDSSPGHASVFVSTTRLRGWRPWVPASCILYQYQIYAPGGIDVVLTLGNRNDYPNQQEISFAGGIRPQYIRIAREYTVSVEPGHRFPYYNLQDTIPNPHPFEPNPASDGVTPAECMCRLRNPICPPRREKRDAEDKTDNRDPCNVRHYIESAFNLSDKKEEAYLFIADQCLLINYAPGTTDDKIIKGPLLIGDCFPYLKDTIFASGIDAAFTSSRENEAYIFRSNIYALINFAADGGKIIQGPKRITDSFHSLKNTIFENGIDAAFTSPGIEHEEREYPKPEAYIFKGDQYALINFAPGTTDDYIIYGPKKITLSFPSLKGTIFEDGLDAAFTSFRKNEAYIFKGDTYALINYAPHSTDDYIVNGPITPISKGFNSLKGIIPMYPCGC